MGKTIDTCFDDGILTFTFTNSEGEVFSSFKLNPTDVRAAARCEEVAAYFADRKNEVEDVSSPASVVAKYNEEIEEKINYILGYDARKTMFPSPITATTIFPNGSIFAFVILDTIANAIAPEIEKRRQKMASGIEKYVGHRIKK